VVVIDIQLIIYAELAQYSAELLVVIVENDLFEGVVCFGNVLGVVVSHIEIEYLPAIDLFPLVAVVHIFLAPEYEADSVAV
jgi:hypothetical protein